VAAASIVAKVTRDRRMRELHREHPQYGFDAHAGYGTVQHVEQLRLHGATAHHRKSFNPLRTWIMQSAIANRL
jgi:ribonuclease HII